MLDVVARLDEPQVVGLADGEDHRLLPACERGWWSDLELDVGSDLGERVGGGGRGHCEEVAVGEEGDVSCTSGLKDDEVRVLGSGIGERRVLEGAVAGDVSGLEIDDGA